MKKALRVCIVQPLLFLTALADQPASWKEYTVSSTNGQYTAEIRATNRNEVVAAREWGYDLVVRQGQAGNTTFVWRVHYDHRGFSEGVLSDDGTVFVYVEAWFWEKSPLVWIYMQGRDKPLLIREEDLPFDRTKLRRPGTQRLWLKSTRDARQIKQNDSEWQVELMTVDDRVLVINTKDGKVTVR